MDEKNTKNDLIGIVISLSDPVLAADIANAWALAYEQHINSLYTIAPSQDAETVRAQSVQSQRDYQTAQGQPEAYLADNPMPRVEKPDPILQTQIKQSYQTALLVEALVNGRELATRSGQMLDRYYADLTILERLLSDARLLQKQVLNGETSSSATFGDSLAMVFLRSRTFADQTDQTDQLTSPILHTSVLASTADPANLEPGGGV